MDLSIIIPSYNTRKLLRRCLESIVQSSKFKVQSEIIVVDNGSKDGSVEMVRSITRIRGTTPFRPSTSFDYALDKSLRTSEGQAGTTRVKLIENKENLGFARAVNQGIRQAEGKTILLLNSDTQVKKGALEKLLEFEEKVRPAIVGARLLNPDGSIQSSCFNLPTIKRAIQEFWLGKKGEFSKYAPTGIIPVGVEAVVGGAILISREVIEKIGMFDERYFMYFEDLDYCRRAKKMDIEVYYLPSARVFHHHGATGREMPEITHRWLVESSKKYNGLVKYYLLTLVIWLGQKWQKLKNRF